MKFAADPEVVGPNARAAVEAMKDGEVVLLENTRYRAEETKNGEAFSKDLASLCDVYVDDAFGTAHRAHCSNVGVTQYVDTAESNMNSRVNSAESLTNSNKAELNSRMDTLDKRLEANVSASTDKDKDYAAEVVDAR